MYHCVVPRDSRAARPPLEFVQRMSITLLAFVGAVREFWRGYTQGPPGS
jgi:hypothetical protein